MTTDKLTTETKIEILNLVRPFVSIDDMCRIDRETDRLAKDEAARREGVENAPKCPQCSAAGYCTGKCNLIPAPPADERAELGKALEQIHALWIDAKARAEAAEAEVARLREAAKAYRQAEQDYVFMAERPDEEYVPADVHLARMHMHRAAAALDAALSQKDPGNG
jgi:hypothetical protein